MNENNSPSSEENQESSSEPGASSAPPPPPDAPNPSEEENQEPKAEESLDSAIASGAFPEEDDSPIPFTPATIPNALTLNHDSWLNQFDSVKESSIEEIRKVVEHGLTPAENDVLIWLAAELIGLAEKHEPDAFARVQTRLALRI